ncbi:GntR family transcriptional regulator [Bacillus sp. A301a_S52]|nr:GntR family transcriptional regulator [Bacillus sp. A301a_S52]
MTDQIQPTFKTARDYIYHTIKKEILSLNLKPGTCISEKEYMERLSSSRTPIREAFVQLSKDELLDIYPQKGTYVSLINVEYVEEGRFIREHLEKEVLKLACDCLAKHDFYKLEALLKMQELAKNHDHMEELFKLDDDFHQTIFNACGKERTWLMIKRMNSHLDRLRMLSLFKSTSWDLIVNQHVLMYEAIKRKDKERVEEIVVEHLRLALIDQVDLKHQYPAYFKE